MLLRRITKHVTEQNWFAVFIDFLIVVVGVFVGLQVQNWNTDRLAKEEEQQVLMQLQEQFSIFIDTSEINIKKQIDNTDSSANILNMIQLGIEPIDVDDFKNTLAKAGSLSAAPSLPTALQELVSSGQLSNLASSDLRSLLTSFYQEFGAHESTTRIVMSLITSPQNRYHQVVVHDPFMRGKVTDYDLTRIDELRPELQNVQIGKKMITIQMKDLLQQARAIQSIVEGELK
ncbi:MAG: hypothetical protein ACSHWU_11815 [Marinicella sp.]